VCARYIIYLHRSVVAFSRSIEKGESRDDEVDDEAVAIRNGVGGTVGAVGAVGGARGELRVRLHRGDADV